MIEVFHFFGECIIYFSVIISLFCVVMFSRLDSLFKIFAIYLIASGSIEILSNTVIALKGNNLMFFHFFSLIEIIVLSKFFERIFVQLEKNIPIRLIYVLAVAFVIANTIFLQPLDTYNTNSSTLVSLIIIGFSVTTFYFLLDDFSKKYKSVKWLVAGLFIYHMTSIIILFAANVMLSFSKESQLNIWFLRAIIIFITKVIFFIIIISEVRGKKLSSG